MLLWSSYYAIFVQKKEIDKKKTPTNVGVVPICSKCCVSRDYSQPDSRTLESKLAIFYNLNILS